MAMNVKKTWWSALVALPLTTALFAAEPTAVAPRVIASGPFEPNWESLEKGYAFPEWFRDAKFGI